MEARTVAFLILALPEHANANVWLFLFLCRQFESLSYLLFVHLRNNILNSFSSYKTVYNELSCRGKQRQ